MLPSLINRYDKNHQLIFVAAHFLSKATQALEGLTTLARTEGIIPALETSHAIYYAVQYAKTLSQDKILMVTVSGRGDKDMMTVAKTMGFNL
jgi:tryptophan synthase beta chain